MEEWSVSWSYYTFFWFTMHSSSGDPDFKDVAKAQVASILDGIAQATISLWRICVASYWPPCLQIWVEKDEEICGDNKSDQRQRTALRQGVHEQAGDPHSGGEIT